MASPSGGAGTGPFRNLTISPQSINNTPRNGIVVDLPATSTVFNTSATISSHNDKNFVPSTTNALNPSLVPSTPSHDQHNSTKPSDKDSPPMENIII